MNPLFHGLLVALATPFTANGDVDLAAFRRLVRHVVRGGADGLVVLGSTGEAATLMDVERDRLIAACLEEAGGRMVVAGAGSNATRQAVEWTRRAEQLGCAGVLVVTPYYNKPVPDGMVAHFHAVADATAKASVIAYNVPGRTGVNLAPPTLLRVMAHEKVLAVKESSGNVQQIGEILRTLPAHRHVLAGDDQLALPSIALGAVGLVSVVGNACPAETKALVDHARAGRLAEARAMHRRLLPVMDAMFVESNPIPLKAALAALGIAEPHLRLPLTAPTHETRELVKRTLAQLGERSAAMEDAVHG